MSKRISRIEHCLLPSTSRCSSCLWLISAHQVQEIAVTDALVLETVKALRAKTQQRFLGYNRQGPPVRTANLKHTLSLGLPMPTQNFCTERAVILVVVGERARCRQDLRWFNYCSCSFHCGFRSCSCSRSRMRLQHCPRAVCVQCGTIQLVYGLCFVHRRAVADDNTLKYVRLPK